jgi:hypothetical protein
MCRFFFLFFLFLSQLFVEKAFSQNEGDSTQNTIGADSSKSDAGDSVETMEINPYSLYRLTSRSGHRSDNPAREVDSQQVRSYGLNPDYAYSNDPDYWKKQPAQKPGKLGGVFNSQWTKWFLYSLMAGLVLFGIFQLARENNFTWLSRRNKTIDPGLVAPVKEEETDFTAAVQKYQADGNYRMAVRFLYLRVLRDMSEKTGIQIRDSSTNAEIAQSFGELTSARDFRFLYRAYEYIFYGDFTPSADLYHSLRNKFEDFQKSLTA